MALALALPAAAAAADTTTRIIVKRDPGLSSAERADIRADADVRFVETLPLPRTEVVDAAPGDVRDALRDLNADRDVKYAELDRAIESSAPDPLLDDFWGLENDGSLDIGGAVAGADMHLPAAWTMSTGAGKTIAVIDTGVDAAHPDLALNMAPGWDFVDGDPYASDLDGHGTHVAGTAAAVRDNGAGGAGVAPDARILPLRVLDENGQGTVSDAIKAYDYAGDHGVQVVNASLGGEGAIQAEKDAIAANPNTLFVVAAGNGDSDEIGDDNDILASADYPCAYDLPNILCVGASKHDDQPASFSNYGATTVDVFAPGWWIWSTIPGGGYGVKYGTSMATPHVAGAATLLLSSNPSLTPTQVRAAIVDSDSVDENPDLTGKSVSNGRANAEGALLIADGDGDGFNDYADNCPGTANPDQWDTTPADGIGDVCQPGPDPDGDTIVASDICPSEAAAYAANGCPGNPAGADADYWPSDLDLCPTQSGPARGCPDGDHDGVGDPVDNCPTVANSGQQNSDNRADGGDACDRDRDNDGRADTSDACPTVYGTAPNGCPLPDRDGDGRLDAADGCPGDYAITLDGCPLPSVTSLTAKAKKRGTARSMIVRVRTSRAAMVRITVQRWKGGRWARVGKKTLATTANRASFTAKRLRRGRHRVVVALWSGAGNGVSATRRISVR